MIRLEKKCLEKKAFRETYCRTAERQADKRTGILIFRVNGVFEKVNDKEIPLK